MSKEKLLALADKWEREDTGSWDDTRESMATELRAALSEEPLGATPKAIDYAHLVGKYVRMERTCQDEVEWAENEGGTVGAEGLVALVRDNVRVGGPCVDVVLDYGYGFSIFEADKDLWVFHVWPSAEVAKELRL